MARALRFGVSRSNGGPNLLAGARELAEVLSAELERPLTVSVSYDYESLLKSVLGAAVEVAWLPPLLHARAVEGGARLVAVCERGGSLYYRSALLVGTDSGIRAPVELAGLRAAWVDRASSSGYVFPKLYLRAAGLGQHGLAAEKFYGSATNACRAVASGEADVCACFLSVAADPASAQREVERMFGPVGQRLRVLAVTDPIPPDGFVVAAHLERSEATVLTRKLLGLHQREAGRAAMRTLLQAERLLPPDDALVRQLERLQKSVV